MASNGAPSGYPSLPSPTVDRRSHYFNHSFVHQFWIWAGMIVATPHSPTSLMRPEESNSGSSAWTFFIDLWTSSSMCSIPTTLPLGPVYSQQRNTAVELNYNLHSLVWSNQGFFSPIIVLSPIRTTYHPCEAGSEISTSWTHIQCRRPVS